VAESPNLFEPHMPGVDVLLPSAKPLNITFVGHTQLEALMQDKPSAFRSSGNSLVSPTWVTASSCSKGIPQRSNTRSGTAMY